MEMTFKLFVITKVQEDEIKVGILLS